jgi:hypothetical protein
MSIFSSIAHEIGHTAESFAHEVGAGVEELEGLVEDLGANGIDVFSNAARLGLSPASFLRSMFTLMHGDPHQLLLNHLVAPFKRVEDPLYTLSTQWNQLAILHQNTSRQIHTHITDLFQGGGSSSYSGPAADTLLNTHQDLQQYFVTLTDHAQTQQGRHATLGGHFSDFLGQAPGKVYSLSTPMAALGVLSYESVATAPPPVLEEPIVEGIEVAIEGVAGGGAALLPEDLPIWPIILLILAILVVILIIVVIIIVIKNAVDNHQKQQKGTSVPTPTPRPSPTPIPQPQNNLTPEQEQLAEKLYNDYKDSGLSLDDIRHLIAQNPNLTEAQLRELLNQYAKVIAANPNLIKKYGALAVFESFVALAAYDAAHGGNYALRQPVKNMPNLQPGIEEAMAEMGVMEDGQIPWPLTPSLDPVYDVIDSTGEHWDEKSYRSVDINGNSYDPAQTAQKLEKDIDKGEKIIFNDSRLTQKEINKTYEELKKNGTDTKVIWWPIQPT